MSKRKRQDRDNFNYYVTMIDYGRRGREAILEPEITYRGVVERVASGEYKDIVFIHHIDETGIEDITEAVMHDAGISEVA